MKFDDFKTGYKGSFTKTITEDVNRKFGELVGDFNPVHFDEERMKKSIFGRRATNGFLTESTIGTALVHMFTSDESIVIALKKEIKLTAPVFIGDTITATVKVKERYPEKQRLLCDCIVKKNDGTIVVEAQFLVKILNV
ncbi:MaoC family dehydratase N-terminal domain-containing protein [Candidatus Woesearchaeota archaeon]|nr:MaoC family dehydratase N-terminal domain-containing protein [Candidatus Woesearchaeota archaeon]